MSGNLLRFFEIIRVLAKYNILNILADLKILSKPIVLIFNCFTIRKSKHPQSKRIRLALQELGPTFIKFGQMLSTRVDLIGDDLAQELSKLQDRVDPSIGKEVFDIIQEEFEQDYRSIFKVLNSKPVASASIAEVFKGVTQNNQEVAIKILRPDIEKQFKKDISLLYKVAYLIEKRSVKYKRLKLHDVIGVFEKTVLKEIDLRFEAAAASELKDNSKNDSGVYIPTIHWKLVSKRVLTLEWIEGVSIYDIKQLKQKKIDLKQLGRNLIYMFLNQSYRDGFFHADLHPGNVLVKNNGDIVLLDFGIIGRLDKRTKIYLAEILKGFVERDYNSIAEVHRRAGYISRNVSLDDFAQACRSVGEPIVGVSTDDISIAKLLTHLFEITEEFNMEVQPQLLLIQKTTVMIEGLISILNANINMWQEAEPWIKEWADQNLKFDSRVVTRMIEVRDMIDDRLNAISAEKIVYREKSNKSSWFIITLLLIVIVITLLR